MRPSCRRLAPASLALTLALGACSPHKVTHNPAAPVAAPASYKAAIAGTLPERWWRDFGDSQLNQLVEKTLTRNLQLEAAWARLQQAEAAAGVAAGGYWPQVTATFSGQRQRFRSPFADATDGTGAAGAIPETFEFNQFNGSLAASYEVDIWKKIGNRARAAGLDAMAARDAAEGLAMTLVSQVVETWFDLHFQNARKKLLLEQVEINETFLELTNLRFQQGLASALDIYQQQQLVVARRGQLALVESAIEVAENRMAVLLGQAPGSVEISPGDALPTMPAMPGIGIPANLLQRRPDLRAAQRQVEAADYRVAAAVAEKLPGLRLQGSLNIQNRDPVELFDNILWTVLGSITAPIFRGGALDAEVDRNRALVREKLASYGDVFVTAMAEVENAIAQERQQHAQIEQLASEAEIAGNALREARTRYREGLSDFLPVLTALQNQQNAELNILQAQRQALSFRVQLLRALGGSWTGELADQPKKETSEPKAEKVRS